MGSRKVIYLIVIFLLVISIVYIPGFVGEEDKHRVITEEEFQTKLENKDYDFSWCVFPFEVNLSGKTLMNADFSNAVFEEEVNFKNTTFKNIYDKNTKFIQTHFKRNAHFEDVIFEGKAAFNSSTFEQAVFFQRENNKEEIAFRKGVSFSHTRFVGYADFGDLCFKNYANFENTIFERSVNFNNTKFLNGSRFNNAEFYGNVDFDKAEFNGDGDYTCFSNTTFEDSIHFRNTIFFGNIFFDNARFKEDAYFNNAEFRGYKTKFDLTSFKGNVYFNNTYLGNNSEDWVLFKADFEKKVIFDPIINCKLDIKEFSILGFAKIDLKGRKLDNIDVIIVISGHVELLDADLTDTKFNDAYIENVNFVECKWPDPFIIYEERNKEDLDLNCTELETIYRNLKISFTKYGQTDLAGKAFYREMECKKKSYQEEKEKGWLWKYLGMWIYNILCGYGERPFNVAFCSVGVITIFAIFFWVLGIEIDTITHYNLEIYNQSVTGFYDDLFSSSRELIFKFRRYHRILDLIWSYLTKYRITEFVSYVSFSIKEFLYCLLFSITSFSTLGTKYIKPRGNASRWLSAVESLIGAFFIALFIYVFARKMLR